MHFQISLSLWELQVIRDWLCVRDINETSLNKLLLFLILKSSHQSCSVEKRVLRNFTGKYLCWSLFLKKSEGWGPATQVFFHWNLQKILRFFFFFFNWDLPHASLRGIELQEKKHNKDYRIQKICSERTYS